VGESTGGTSGSGAPVVIGMDPHKRTVTIEVMSAGEQVVGHGRFTTDEGGFSAMLDCASRWAQRYTRSGRPGPAAGSARR
jgi:hypothetical protein